MIRGGLKIAQRSGSLLSVGITASARSLSASFHTAPKQSQRPFASLASPLAATATAAAPKVSAGFMAVPTVAAVASNASAVSCEALLATPARYICKLFTNRPLH